MASLFRRKKKTPELSETLPAKSTDYRAVAATDVGAVRKNNEDNLVFIRPFDLEKRATKGCLALVADGMGGHSSGEIASQMATELIARTYFDKEQEILTALTFAFEKANKAIYRRASKNSALSGMGTTCTAVVLQGAQIYLAHVGDSRAYLLKQDQLIQLSSDHTYVQHLLDQGVISEAEANTHPKRNVITRAMGTAPRLKVDCFQHKLSFEEGDKLLLCSDGLYEYLPREELTEWMLALPIQEAAKELIDLAKQRGGHDNISVLMVESVRKDSEQPLKQTQKQQAP